MGCAQSAEGNNKQNGENLVGPNEPPAPAPPDPRLPLTARQKYSMVASWKGISRAMETTGINMFIKWVYYLYVSYIICSKLNKGSNLVHLKM